MNYNSIKGALFLMMAFLISCANPYRDFADKNSDSYRFDLAKKNIDDMEFASAISFIEPLLAKYPTNEEIAHTGVSAYAGRAGLRVLELFQEIQEGVSSMGLFKIFARHFPGTVQLNIDDIEKSISIIETYGAAPADRSLDMNLLGLFIYYSEIGVNLNFYAFVPDTIDLNPTFDACDNVALPHAAVDKIVVALYKIQSEIAKISETSSAFAGVTGALDVLGAFPDTSDCATTPANPFCVLTRNLLNGSQIGLNTGVDLNITCGI